MDIVSFIIGGVVGFIAAGLSVTIAIAVMAVRLHNKKKNGRIL